MQLYVHAFSPYTNTRQVKQYLPYYIVLVKDNQNSSQVKALTALCDHQIERSLVSRITNQMHVVSKFLNAEC